MSMEMNRILITGGCGFVGSSLSLRMRRAYPSAEVVALDNFYRSGSELNARRIEAAGVHVMRADVRDLDTGIGPFDLVIDAAAEPSVMAGKRGDDPSYVVNTNLKGTLNCLEAARTWSSRFLFLSTSRIYPVAALKSLKLKETETRFVLEFEQDRCGVSDMGISEAFDGDGARTLYGATKYASEIMAREYAAQLGLRVLIDRCGVLAGPWQMGRVDQGVTALWAGAHVFGRPLKYIGYAGKQVRDALHIEDLGDLVLKQLEFGAAWAGNVYNVGGGCQVSYSLLELTALCEKASGREIPIEHVSDVRDGDVPLYITDATKVSQEFGWRPQHSVSDIVDDTVGWIRDNADTLREVFSS